MRIWRAATTVVSVKPLLDCAPRFADLIEGKPDEASDATLRRAELIGRPFGAPAFLDHRASTRPRGRAGRTRAQAERCQRGSNQIVKYGRVTVFPLFPVVMSGGFPDTLR